jgi:UrcA family protein
MKTFLALSTVLLAAVAGAAFANETSVAVEGSLPSTSGIVMKRVTVSYGDLNLAAKPDAAALLERLKRAAAAVCTSQTKGHALASSDAIKHCHIDAVRQAVDRVGSPELAALANE